MATIGNDPNGLKRILFMAGDGSRKTIRLGKMSKKQANTVLLFVENLLAAARGAKVIEHTTADRWAGQLHLQPTRRNRAGENSRQGCPHPRRPH